MTWGSIVAVGYVALRVRDLDAAVHSASTILGLREAERVGDTAYLTHGPVHHSLVYKRAQEDAVDHIAFEVAGPAALTLLREQVEAAGLPILSDEPLERGLAAGFAFLGPEGFVYELYHGMAEREPDPRQPPFGPERFGHINLNPAELEPVRSFYEEVLGFRVSEVIGDGLGYFMRCNVDHHGVALVPGRGTFHHHAWEAQSIADLGHLGDRVDAAGGKLIWGPVRHGAGHNIAVYYVEPPGTVVELYTDLERIYDPDRPPIRWETESGRWFNRWGSFRPEDFRAYGLPPASRQAR